MTLGFRSSDIIPHELARVQDIICIINIILEYHTSHVLYVTFMETIQL